MQYLSKLTKRLAQCWYRPAVVVAFCACAADAPTANEADAPSLKSLTSSTAASISISPSSASGTLGQSAQFTATVYDSRGRVLTGKLITWKSTDSTVVVISTSGYATAIGVGNASLVATTGSVSAQVPVSVTGVAVATISLTPTSASGSVGQSAQFTATLRDASGNTLTGRRVLWTSSAPSIVKVDTTGYATALAAGSATITAFSGGVSATAVASVGAPAAPAVASVVVSPSSASGTVGDAAQFTAAAYDAAGNVMSGQSITWSTTNANVVTVTAGGYATATGGGSASLIATIGGKTGSAAITVTGTTSGGGTSTTDTTQSSGGGSTPPAGNGEPMPNFGTMIWHDAFDVTLTSAMLSNYATMQGGYLNADLTGGIGGTPALRMDWPKSTTCQDDWTGIERGIPGAPTEIYVQFSVRYQQGFLFDWTQTGATPCAGNAKKLFLIWSGDNRSRFIYVSEDHDLRAASDYEDALGTNRSQNTGSTMSLAQYADGNWHRVTFHIKQSSSTTATDGFLYGWIDGVLRWSKPNWASGSVGGWVDFKFPSTFNQGSPANQSEWLDNLSIWRP